ncbi:5-(carboxyamino)imidazole ribonucleotide synthase [Peribacillus deserti]|uniref:N5-carboxyaminoimidazole ribonucleotide synthase n=1 Tax=Peribacillus deserti TaxID=673318 RepID=A0A2N5LZE7_9BACI|nr:5-(carboxyamino)imidazole ribonucleotide synthase [Peribacillus deserti]PLT27496.1 5-(carboxyamino)imidazole ribonucleotide synthase [Peribacillus deserti]
MNNLHFKTILPGQTIGIIGGGQLGRMMALAAKASGFKIAVLDPTPDCPCSQVADTAITSDYDNLEALEQLATISDVITFEFENINAESLEWLRNYAYIPQGTEILRISQNRVLEKEAIQKAGVPVAPYAVINEASQVHEQVQKLGYPCVLKTATGGYDGKGQHVIRAESDIAEAAGLLRNGPCVLEAWVPFVKEISVIVTRKGNGDYTVFPTAENIHIQNILHQTIVPARISGPAFEAAEEKAVRLAEHLELVGTLAVEMFLTEAGEIVINEIAPRPHNSGHYTMEACQTSQFEQHIRAVCNWPLGSTELLKPVVMVNILGEHLERLLEEIPVLDDWKVHLYGKKEAKEKRKMGHVNILRKSVDDALRDAGMSKIWQA